ncbi:DUF3826 domain-containing protein [Dyadobacter sp. CY312]|uniref:DUF3826 domain-containing protein n=1 Tax=Dyadobacter sp. CY312 TaxID=2907303 RepID=UPI001F1FEADE|nr:DUF3826 domain-containing protein [Dyadobacter sp. CY312]MCE7041367.1 DUF3826 domain-containing protein [Dyadobacter sp. CY312]
MKVIHILLCMLISAPILKAQDKTAGEAAYIKTVTQRSDKILAALQLPDSAKYKRVRASMVNQYVALNDYHEQKKKQSADESRLSALHTRYISELSSELNKKEVDQIKDGMTYGVLPVTNKAYQDMIPSLKEEEKAQIMTWLTEARELAMDAGSSEEKHQVFGKYKGRINNYLSAHGYDLQKERKEWEERIKAEKSKK